MFASMARRRTISTSLRAPWLRRLWVEESRIVAGEFPFTLPFARPQFGLEFRERVTMFVGENSTGKSTLLEAIAGHCGFGAQGGTRDHRFAGADSSDGLEAALRFAWLPKVTRGFFLRAESFFNWAGWIDQVSPGSDAGRALHRLSHGESFLATFERRFGDGAPAIFLLDEPEAALSPSRQLALLVFVDQLVRQKGSQLVIATHSPILMAYPDATIYQLRPEGEITQVAYEDTEHFQVTRDFLNHREDFLRHLFSDSEC
jgi:predicted ATPase